jgi:hypothetical protein
MPTATRVRDQCLSPSRAVDAPVGEGRYQRLFPELPPLDCDDDALHALGRVGGVCDTVEGVGAEVPTPRRRPAGPCSGSSWPTTSPPTARR